MWLVPRMVPLKNTPAAEKTDSLATGGNPVGTGKGRGVRQWGILMVLSLIMGRMASLLPENHLSVEKQSPAQDCGKCLKTTLTEQVAIKTMAYLTHYNCKTSNEKGNCIHNGTRYKMCQLETKVICYDQKAIPQDWWLKMQSKKNIYKETLTHVLHK